MTETIIADSMPNVDLLAVAVGSGRSLSRPCDEDCDEAQFLLHRYRVRTVKILQRYFRLQVEAGRLQSLMGQMESRAKISSYALRTFEDAVIFVHDVERCLLELDPFSQKLIVLAVLQEHSPKVVAQIMHCGTRTVERTVPESLDQMTRGLLEKGILPGGLPEQKPRGSEASGVFSLDD